MGHHTSRCKEGLSCVVCSRSHVAEMCPDIHVNKNEHKALDKTNNDPEISRDQTLTHQTNTHVFLQTLRTVRDLIDSGHIFLEDTATQLGLQPKRQEKLNNCLFGGSEMISTHQCYEVTVNSGNFSFSFEALDQTNICSDVAVVFQGLWTNEMKTLNIEILDTKQPGLIELLFGADVITSLYTVPRSNGVTITLNLLIKNSSITDLWELEDIGIQSPVDKQSKTAREIFWRPCQ
ncbi:hypothetical protein NQ318_011890 [Aromia moschata]|uniref:Uncharacterized protein n=1 Tax=Aromia moschata TaxID=1265417 RepID=A0AAV8YC04_9CUCU|nr:hypothetical protein NQ318_011890 [Aromia moschata]